MPKIYRQSITAAKDSPFQEGDIAVFIAPEQNESSLRKIDAMTQFVRPPGVVLRPAGNSYEVVAELSGALHAKHTHRSRSSIEIVHALGTPPCPYLSLCTEPHSSTLADYCDNLKSHTLNSLQSKDARESLTSARKLLLSTLEQLATGKIHHTSLAESKKPDLPMYSAPIR